MENHFDFLLGQPSISAKRLLLRLCEALAALLALVPLNLRPTVETGLHHLYPAVVTRHGLNLLAIHSRKPDNEFGEPVRLRLCSFRPRWRLASLSGLFSSQSNHT
jgi:hypothetical protein